MNPTLMLLFCFALLSSEHQSSTGTIRGTVTSLSTGERIVNAKVALEGRPLSTYTDSNGLFRLANIPDGVCSLTISAQSYARLTFQGVIVPEFTPLVINAKLRDSTTSRDSVIVMKYSPVHAPQLQDEDKMMFYKPDSTIDYKIRIANPDARSNVNSTTVTPDSVRRHK